MTPPLRRPHQPSGLAPPCSRKNGGVPHAELHPCWAALSQQHPLLIGSPLGVQPYNTPGRSALITTEAQGDLSNGSWSGKSSKTRAWPSQQGAAGVNCDRQTLKYHQPGTSEGTYDTRAHGAWGGGRCSLGHSGKGVAAKWQAGVQARVPRWEGPRTGRDSMAGGVPTCHFHLSDLEAEGGRPGLGY